jgi:hypothetical protein
MRFSQFITEQKEKHAVLAFGRMNPITVGHEKLVNKVHDIAKKVGGSAHIVVSHSQDEKKNPLSAEQKLKHAKRAFPDVHVTASDKESPNFLSQAAKLHKQGVTHLHMVGGQDRVDEYHKLLHKYNNVKGPHGHFNFKGIKVHSAGDRDPDAEGVEGMSASKMREHASKGNFKEFRKGVPSKMNDSHAKEMYNDVRKGMGIHEDINYEFEELLFEGVHDKGIFKAVFLAGGPGSGKDYVLDNTLAGHGLTEINSDKAFEFLMDKNNLDMRMPENEKERRDVVRGKAKNITELRQRLALFGRNGLIINGTGDDPQKLARIKERLEELGYDTSMIMVNTRDEVSAARNVERGQRGGRTVPEDIRSQKWKAVQKARPELAKLFGDTYREFDNSEDLRNVRPEIKQQKEEELMDLYKGVQKFISKPPKSDSSKEWIASELQKKDTQKIDRKAEVTPHEGSNAAEQARKMDLEYYGFGRYGKNGKVTHRSIHDKLVDVSKSTEKDVTMPVPGTSMRKVNEDFEEFFSEDLRQWFNPSHPKGGWKRINSKGQAIGPCAREPGEPKPKCMSNEKRAALTQKERASAVRAKRKHDPNPERQGKPINVSNFGKGKLSESYELSDSGAINILLLGNRVDEYNLDNEYTHQEEKKYLKDKNGRIRTFMLRRAAAKEAHTKNGTVIPYKNGYVVQLNEENENDISRIFERPVLGEEARTKESASSGRSYLSEGISSRSTNTGTRASSIREYAELTTGQEYARGEGITSAGTEAPPAGKKITIGQIRSRQKKAEVKESIDKGIEPGLSMSASGENSGRPSLKTKQNKKPFEEAIGAGGEDVNSIGAKKEDELKKVGISLTTFKAKRPI